MSADIFEVQKTEVKHPLFRLKIVSSVAGTTRMHPCTMIPGSPPPVANGQLLRVPQSQVVAVGYGLPFIHE